MDLVETWREELRFAPGRVTRALLAAAYAFSIALPFLGQPARIVRGKLVGITGVGVMG